MLLVNAQVGGRIACVYKLIMISDRSPGNVRILISQQWSVVAYLT